MNRILRGFFALAVLLGGATAVGPPDASAQWINNRTVTNSSNYFARIPKPGLQPQSCANYCRERRCRTWVYVRGNHASNGVPYCLLFRERKRLVHNNCCYAGRGRGGATPPPPPSGRRRVYNNPRWNGRIVDHCRTWATNCGQAGANHYCRLRGFQRAQSFSRFRPGSTYVIGSRRVCNGRGCVGFRQVVCVGRRSGGVTPPPGGGGRVVRINNPRWRGAIVDHCSTWARNCGRGGADRYCRRRGFRSAVSWSTYRPGRTFVIGSNRYCNGSGCVGFRYVNCRR